MHQQILKLEDCIQQLQKDLKWARHAYMNTRHIDQACAAYQAERIQQIIAAIDAARLNISLLEHNPIEVCRILSAAGVNYFFENGHIHLPIRKNAEL